MKAPETKASAGLAQQIDREAAAWLSIFREVRAWLVVPHRSPDADTLGSALGLAALLERLGARVAVACADSVARYDYLPGADKVLTGKLPEDWPADAGVVTLDAAEFDRLGAMGPLIANMRPFVNIDHHISNQRFGSLNWIDVASAATGEMVYLLYAHFGVPIDRDAATDLYAALVTDTGFFRYPATTPRTLEVAAALVAAGVDFSSLISAIYERRSAAAVRLMGLALAGLRLEAGGRVAWTSVSTSMFAAAEAGDDDAEGIVDQLRTIAGVEVFYILREHADGVRVSLRAKGHHNVDAIARHFGGGGHLLASGCVINRPLDEAERQLREVVLAHLKA